MCNTANVFQEKVSITIYRSTGTSSFFNTQKQNKNLINQIFVNADQMSHNQSGILFIFLFFNK